MAGGKSNKMKLSYFTDFMRRWGSLRKTVMLGRKYNTAGNEEEQGGDGLTPQNESTRAEQLLRTGDGGRHSCVGSPVVSVDSIAHNTDKEKAQEVKLPNPCLQRTRGQNGNGEISENIL